MFLITCLAGYYCTKVPICTEWCRLTTVRGVSYGASPIGAVPIIINKRDVASIAKQSC